MASIRGAAERKTDLLVVGGGIYGLWLAADAAGRGLSVRLIEQGDFGGATSCASSKLIHGGLRYLERFELSLVRGSLRERKTLLELAPHRVRPLRFVVPLYRGARLGPLRLRAGLWLYDRLAGRGFDLGGRRREKLDALTERVPWLRRDGLRAAWSYADAQTDDARFNLDVVRLAREAGAVLERGVRAEGWIEERGRYVGARVRHLDDGTLGERRAHAIAVAAGPWTDRLLPRRSDIPPPRRTKGVHLALPDAGLERAFLLTSPLDGRVFFLIPWYGRTLVGTTDTDDPSAPERVRAKRPDVEYLLESANAFRREPWTRDDVRAVWCGLRTLRASRGLESAATREWLFEAAGPGLWVAIGGKYTSARADAARAIDRLASEFDRPLPASATGTTRFPDAPPEPFDAWLRDAVARGRDRGLDEEAARTLALRRGLDVDALLDDAEQRPAALQRLDPEVPFVLADAERAWEREDVRSLADLWVRRVPLARVSGAVALRRATEKLGRGLGWSRGELEDRVEEAAALDGSPFPVAPA